LNWQVYIIRCSDDTLYTGITTDIERRVRQHADGSGAKYFRGRQPKQLLFLEEGHDRSSASKRELCIKAMKRAEKQQLVQSATFTSQAALGRAGLTEDMEGAAAMPVDKSVGKLLAGC
jgi:putative endonuclease